jgi:sigma-B regulation protein RsbU (phosphoserine phosphatase)
MVGILLLFGAAVGIIGYYRFTGSLTAEYNASSVLIAETAARLIDGDKIDAWQLRGEKDTDYIRTKLNLEAFHAAQKVTQIYVIDVDRSDYGRFTSVFNTVSKGSGYTPWHIGYERDTTNEEYRKIYRDIYENGLECGTVVRTSGLNGKEPHITSLVPVRRSDGTVRAILCVQCPMEELDRGRQVYIAFVAVVAVLALLLSSLAIYFFLKKQFVIPLERIMKEADRFARETRTEGGDRLENISKIREIDTLAVSLMQMEEDTERKISEITSLTGEKERIGAELGIAARIQKEILPRDLQKISDRSNAVFLAKMKVANEVGGDFYDCYLLDKEIAAFVIGDVSGKGVPAALFMVLAKTLLKDTLMMTGSVRAAMKHTNNVLFDNSGGDMFVTCFLGLLDMTSGELIYVNAGHTPPVVTRNDGSAEFLKDPVRQLVLSGFPDYDYQENRIRLGPGDGIFLYTDGVTEARNGAGELYGTARLLSWFRERSQEEIRNGCIDALFSELEGFRGKAGQWDDTAMLQVLVKTDR